MNKKHIKIEVPEGYEIDWENSEKSGNEIKFKKKKSSYPENYFDLMQLETSRSQNILHYVDVQGVPQRASNTSEHLLGVTDFKQAEAISALLTLIRFRNAWWGDWRPDWNTPTLKFTIQNIFGLVKYDYSTKNSRILSFPTAEQRDAFYKTFSQLIEKAKEFL